MQFLVILPQIEDERINEESFDYVELNQLETFYKIVLSNLVYDCDLLVVEGILRYYEAYACIFG